MQFTINMVDGKHLHINKEGYSFLHIGFKQPPVDKVSTVYLLCIYFVPTMGQALSQTVSQGLIIMVVLMAL